MVDLTKMDEYSDLDIPDADVEMALKVIRTLRNACLKASLGEYATEIVVLSQAHKVIHDLVEKTGNHIPKEALTDADS